MISFKKNKLSEICTTALLAGGLASGSVLAATAAGTLIKNLATVTYQDANGNQFSAQSNEALITVKKVNSASIGNDNSKPASAGQVVYSQHILENTGNDEDSYTINIANETGDDLDSTNLQVYLENSTPNGTADTGEQEVTGQTITLAAGQKAYLVVSIPVPSNATLDQELHTKLTITSSSGTTVTDSGTNTDTTDGTVQTFITLSNAAVIGFTKEAVLDDSNPSLHKITYTLTANNTGNAAATDVRLYDAIPQGTSFVAGSINVSGLLATNGDTLPTGTSTIDESVIGMDINDNNVATDTVTGIEAVDTDLAPGQAISLQFAVEYNPESLSAGDAVTNIGFLKAVTDASAPPETFESTPAEVIVPQLYSVTADEGALAPAASGGTDTTNDGIDDDGTADDIVTVDEAPAGGEAEFQVKVTNTGNGDDTFELAIDPGTFPAGTVFTFWNEAGSVQLVDSNSIGSVDTGSLPGVASAPNNEKIFKVRAKLPANATAGGTATFTATSAKDPGGTADSTTLTLSNVAVARVDLHDNTDTSDPDKDPLGSSPYALTGRTVFDGQVGGTVNIPFYVNNESGSPDSYTFSAGSSWDGTTVGSLPAGWTITFYKGDGSGNPSGAAINASELLPGGSLDNEYVAVIAIPAEPSRAPADYVADNDGDAADDTLDGNTDGDGDVPVFIRIASSSGTNDIMLDAIDVAPAADVTLAPNGNNQAQPGGSISYAHTMTNAGNTEETLAISSSNSLSADNWNNVIMVDTTGDGQFDKAVANLVSGTDVIKGFDANGDAVDLAVSAANTVVMPAGSKFNFQAVVQAPTQAAAGDTDILTVTATNAGSGPDASLTDTTTIIDGKVTLTKMVAYDPDCDATPDTAFANNLTDRVAPQECAIWEITAENLGNTNAENTIIKDAITPFSTFEAGSLRYGLGNGATLNTVTDAVGDDAGELDGSDIVFYVGTSSDPATKQGGQLVAGEKATVRFSIRVD